jgi:hypothetical protein
MRETFVRVDGQLRSGLSVRGRRRRSKSERGRKNEESGSATRTVGSLFGFFHNAGASCASFVPSEAPFAAERRVVFVRRIRSRARK